jgi:hypothetical protein
LLVNTTEPYFVRHRLSLFIDGNCSYYRLEIAIQQHFVFEYTRKGGVVRLFDFLPAEGIAQKKSDQALHGETKIFSNRA